MSVRKFPDGEVYTATTYEDMRKFLDSVDIIIGHNFIRWDKPHLERILGIKIKARIIDTLALSWYLHPKRLKHGLDGWGDDLHIKKPEIHDWYTKELKEYVYRCEQDVLINHSLFSSFWEHLLEIYESEKKALRLTDYLSFKMKCAQLAEHNKWKLDVDYAEKALAKLTTKKTEAFIALKEKMPKVPIYRTRTIPKARFKQNGNFTKHWGSWVSQCQYLGKDPETTKEIKISVGFEDPNPDSHQQIKDWLFSLGWEPCTHKTNDKGKEVPQLADGQGEDRKLTPSVLLLAEKEPTVKHLEGYYTLRS
jgi:hypothetical protein